MEILGELRMIGGMGLLDSCLYLRRSHLYLRMRRLVDQKVVLLSLDFRMMVDLGVVVYIRELCMLMKFAHVLHLVERQSRGVVHLLVLMVRHVDLREGLLEVVILLRLRNCVKGLEVVLYRSRHF